MVYPIFVGPGKGVRKEISSMPGQFNLSIDRAVEVAREAEKFGVGGLLLFGLPLHKDETGSEVEKLRRSIFLPGHGGRTAGSGETTLA